MIIVFLLQLFFKGFTELFILDANAIPQVWRFFTAIFLHGGLAHLLYNMFALALFGSILESLIGARRFLLVFFVTGIIANIIAVNFYSASLGASGAIFGVIGALIIVRPLLIVWAFGLPMPIFVAGILWGIGDVIGAVGYLSGNPIDDTGNIAHLSGMFFGFIFGALFRNKAKERKNITEKADRVKIKENEMREWEDYYFKNADRLHS